MLEFASIALRRLTGKKSTRGTKPRRDREFKRRPQVETLEDRRLLAQTVGVFVNHDDAYDGYTLVAPSLSNTTYLIDNQGRMVNSWKSNFQPMTSYLITEITNPNARLKNGDMIRAARLPNPPIMNAAGASGRIEVFTWQGKLKWSYTQHNTRLQLHHDFEVLPNGNVLMIAWERKTRAQVIAAGRNPATLGGSGDLWFDTVLEVRPNATGHGGKIVWKWSSFDHLVQTRYPNKPNHKASLSNNPQLLHLNFESAGEPGAERTPEDWTHANGLDYNAKLDQIVISARDFSEMWVIEHSNTTAIARGHTGGQYGKGGDLLFRWGNPRTYGAGTKADQKMWYQHDAHWVPEGNPGSETGNITVFDNGVGRPGADHSAVLEITPVIDPVTNDYETVPGKKRFAPEATTWQYTSAPKTNFYSSIISGAVRLPNGNTLINEGVKGKMFEVTPDKRKVWIYVNPVIPSGPLQQGRPIPPSGFLSTRQNFVFRAHKYGPDSPAFVGKTLISGRTIELNEGDTAGLYNPANGRFYLNNRSNGSTGSVQIFKGPRRAARVTALAGDWNGNGKDSVGFYDPKFKHWTFYDNTNGTGAAVQKFARAAAKGSWRPVVGDWDGDGVDTYGYLDANTGDWHLYNEMGPLAAEEPVFKWAAFRKSYKPVTGDWNGDGKDTIGFYDPKRNRWLLNNKNDGTGGNTIIFTWRLKHAASWKPVTGDWELDTRDSVGLYNPNTNTWHLNRRNVAGLGHTIHFKGPNVPATLKPIAGNWNGSKLKGDPMPNVIPLTLDPQSETHGGVTVPLTDDELAPLVDSAVTRLSAFEGARAAADLQNLSVEIVDLPGSRLGQVVGGSTVQMDIDAAGAGWFIDSSPADDVEFALTSEPVDGVDLLTAVMHELGHVVGLGHADAGVMDDTLPAGVRRSWDDAIDEIHAAGV